MQLIQASRPRQQEKAEIPSKDGRTYSQKGEGKDSASNGLE